MARVKPGPAGGYAYACTRAELANIPITPQEFKNMTGIYPMVPVDWDEIPERRPKRDGLRKLRAAMQAKREPSDG